MEQCIPCKTAYGKCDKELNEMLVVDFMRDWDESDTQQANQTDHNYRCHRHQPRFSVRGLSRQVTIISCTARTLVSL